MKVKEGINKNFDLSIIIPFYRKMKEFGEVFPKNLKYFQRNGIEIKNKPCLSCSILPLCHGGCTQNASKRKVEYCVNGFDEARKAQVVLDRIEYNIIHSTNVRSTK